MLCAAPPPYGEAPTLPSAAGIVLARLSDTRWTRLLGTSVLLLPLACAAPPEPSPTPESTPTGTAAPLSSGITLLSPYEGQRITTQTLWIEAQLAPEIELTSVEGRLGTVPIDSYLSVDPDTRRLRGEGIPLPDTATGELELTALTARGEKARVTRSFQPYPGQALATVITREEELIDGPERKGRLGDILLMNDRIQLILSQLGRQFDYLNLYGGHLIDADLIRPPWEPERDGVGAILPMINIESTDNPQSLSILNDGKDGNPVVIQTEGPDDLVVTYNPSTMAPLLIPSELSGLPIGTYIPYAADDKDLPIRIRTTWTLKPGASYVTIDSEVINESSQEVSFYTGDMLNLTGELDYFSPGFGFRADIYFRHEGDFFAWTGFGQNLGISYGMIPHEWPSSTISLPGTVLAFYGQDSLAVVVDSAPPAVTLSGGKSWHSIRTFAVTEHIGEISEIRCEVRGLYCGEISGTVLQKGVPVEGANVTLWRASTPLEAYTNRTQQMITHFRTGPDGTFRGAVEEGSYKLAAEVPGTEYPTGDERPPTEDVKVKRGEVATASFGFQNSACLRVLVTDANGLPLPAKVSLVGFDPSPMPLIEPIAPVGYESTGAMFNDIWADKLPYGVAKVGLANAQGDTGELVVEPGEYQLVVSHGPFWSIWSQVVELTDQTPVSLQVQLAQVVSTEGMVSGDFHVHGIDSFDARIPRDWRLTGMAAEEVDVFASTDHNARTNFSPDLERLGLADRVVSIIGEEMTTFDLGHFNAFPMPLEDKPNGGSMDWVGPFEPGASYPSSGRYDLSPSELMNAVNTLPGNRVFMVNHPNTLTLGYFSLTGLDTAALPDPKAYVPTCLTRQEPGTELWSPDFHALELWRLYEDAPTLLEQENLGDWFNLLNRGIIRTSLSNSDTHASTILPPGGPRNLIAVGSDVAFTPEGMGDELATRIKEGRVINTNAPVLSLRILNGSGDVASHLVSDPTLITAESGAVELHIRVQSASWAAFDQLLLYINAPTRPVIPDSGDAPGATYPISNCPGQEVSIPEVARYEVTPTFTLQAGTDFEIQTMVVDPSVPGAERLEASLIVPLTLSKDSWVVALVRGTEGVSSPLFPMQPGGLDEETNTDLADLMDGNLGEGGVLAQAFTNPLFVDVDGNGRFDPPGLQVSEGVRVQVRRVQKRVSGGSQRHLALPPTASKRNQPPALAHAAPSHSIQ